MKGIALIILCDKGHFVNLIFNEVSRKMLRLPGRFIVVCCGTTMSQSYSRLISHEVSQHFIMVAKTFVQLCLFTESIDN